MTLTSPGCPLHAFMTQKVKKRVESLENVRKAETELVWDPPWNPERMSTQAKKKLGLE